MPSTNTEGGSPSASPPPGARILLVIGNVDTLTLVRLVLERAGHEVLTASTAAGAERLVPGGRPIDLVIAATSLPDADGVEFVRGLGRRFGCRTITVARIGQEEEARRSERAGVDAHVMEHALAAGLGHVVATLTGPPRRG